MKTILDGDVIFVSYENNKIDSAISKVELGYEKNIFNHVGIYKNKKIIEATPSGVTESTIESFIENSSGNILIARHELGIKAFDIAKHLIGSKYNKSFIRNDKEFYCSELIHYVFEKANGSELFKKHKLSFSDDKNIISDFWNNYYQELGIEVPVNEFGSNPQNLSKSSIFCEKIILCNKGDLNYGKN